LLLRCILCVLFGCPLLGGSFFSSLVLGQLVGLLLLDSALLEIDLLLALVTNLVYGCLRNKRRLLLGVHCPPLTTHGFDDVSVGDGRVLLLYLRSPHCLVAEEGARRFFRSVWVLLLLLGCLAGLFRLNLSLRGDNRGLLFLGLDFLLA